MSASASSPAHRAKQLVPFAYQLECAGLLAPVDVSLADAAWTCELAPIIASLEFDARQMIRLEESWQQRVRCMARLVQCSTVGPPVTDLPKHLINTPAIATKEQAVYALGCCVSELRSNLADQTRMDKNQKE